VGNNCLRKIAYCFGLCVALDGNWSAKELWSFICDKPFINIKLLLKDITIVDPQTNQLDFIASGYLYYAIIFLNWNNEFLKNTITRLVIAIKELLEF